MIHWSFPLPLKSETVEIKHCAKSRQAEYFQLDLLAYARGIVRMSTVSPATELCRFPFSFCARTLRSTFTGMEGADPIVAAPAMPFDVLRGRLHLLGLSDRDIRQLERTDEFMHLHFRNPQIASVFFRVPELFGKPASRAEPR
jgi:hypothetical protein